MRSDAAFVFPRAFKPLAQRARYKVVKGGRGSAKSHTFAAHMVLRAASTPGFRGLGIREVQKSIAESSKRLIEDKIGELNSRGYDLSGFDCQRGQTVTPGGGVIAYVGMQDHTADSVKSYEGFDVGWVEEAQTFSERSLELLRPTIRKPGSELWFTYNPRSAEDPVDRFFVGKTPPPDSIILHINYDQNPFFPSELEVERLHDEATNAERYAHIWLGDYEPQAVGAIFNRANLAEYRRTVEDLESGAIELHRIIVAVDHAVSAEEGSNEHGIIVAGKGEDERGYLIEDGSLSGSPRQWARRAVELFDKHDADAIVIERNQGGDLVRQTLEAERVGLPIIEVHASRGKHVRAEPIASRYEAGQVSHVGTFPVLEDQLCKITPAGYDGDGSPDRADALVWAMTELFPTMGEGNVYRTSEADFVAEAFKIPTGWPRAFALDVGSDKTAAIWGAVDTNVDTLYIYSVDLREQADLATQAASIKLRGDWIPGAFVPTGNRRTEEVGRQVLSGYLGQGVRLNPIPDPFDAGTAAVANRLATGRIKVLRTCVDWLREYRTYHRGDDGKPVDEGHALMRATRLLVMGGLSLATTKKVMDTTGKRTARHRVGY